MRTLRPFVAAVIVLTASPFTTAPAAFAPEPMYRASDGALQAVVIPTRIRDGVELPDPDALVAAIESLRSLRPTETDGQTAVQAEPAPAPRAPRRVAMRAMRVTISSISEETLTDAAAPAVIAPAAPVEELPPAGKPSLPVNAPGA